MRHLVFTLLFSSFVLSAQNAEHAFSLSCYLNGNVDHTYWVTADSRETTTELNFYLKSPSGALGESEKLTVDGQVEALSTLSSMLVLYTSGPGENTYIVREVGDRPAVVWHCNSRFAAEVGPNWAMCFSGERYRGNTLLPQNATLFQRDNSETYRKAVTVPYSDRYGALARKHF